MPSRAAVVITTYNSARELGICLRSFTNQSNNDFDIFIAEDGEDKETEYKIAQFRDFFPDRIQHRRHSDQGYRKAKINNDVFRELHNYDVIICVDGDTFQHQNFVEDHLKMHDKHDRLLFMGRRIDLGPKVTESITEENVLGFNQGPSWKLFQSVIDGETKNMSRAFRIGNMLLQKILKRDKVADLLGSNYSISTKLMFEVNGYDEDYQSYWGEDGDLFVRVRNAGATIRGMKSYAIQFHLFHKRRDPTKEHESRYQELLQDFSYRRCRNGIEKA